MSQHESSWDASLSRDRNTPAPLQAVYTSARQVYLHKIYSFLSTFSLVLNFILVHFLIKYLNPSYSKTGASFHLPKS